MISQVLVNLFRFAALIFLQVLVMDKLHLGLHINPYIYPLFILLLPVTISHTFLMLIAFFLGLTVDVFSNSLGIHAAACVLMAFIRPAVLGRIAPKGAFEGDPGIKLGYFGFSWFLTYAVTLVLAHHSLLFFLELIGFAPVWIIFQKILINTVFSVALIILFELIFYSRRKRG